MLRDHINLRMSKKAQWTTVFALLGSSVLIDFKNSFISIGVDGILIGLAIYFIFAIKNGTFDN